MKLVKKYKFLFFIPLVLAIILSCIYYNNQTKSEVVVDNQISEIMTLTDENKIKEKKLKVDIKGAIKKPGVYEIIEGSRVIDVVGVSGGFNYNAYTSNINLSRILQDEDVVIIYTKEEIEAFKKNNVIVEYVEKECPIIDNIECDCPTIENAACIKDENVTTNEDSENKLVNLNTATKEELMSLSNIGESKADLIIEYRNKSKFKSIEELKNVKGIGDSIYDKIKDFIKV